MNSPKTLARQKLSLKSSRSLAGYQFGFKQPCVLVKLTCEGVSSLTVDLVLRLRAEIEADLPAHSCDQLPTSKMPPVALLLLEMTRLAGAMQDSVGLAVVHCGKIVGIDPKPDAALDDPRDWIIALPSFKPKAAEIALKAVMSRLDHLMDHDQSKDASVDVDAAFNAALDKVAAFAPQGSNTPKLLRAALKRDIPMVALPGGAWQFGWGRRARIFKSSLSDATSAIATSWAKDKSQTNSLLRLAGFPVPEQRTIQTLAAALKAASEIGYPVVLKPADLEQGIGVEAGLANEKQVRVAFARVAGKRRRVLLEKHIDGQDVRVNIVNGKYHDSVLRTPAGVIGDGCSTIQELVEIENKDPRRSVRRFSSMRPLKLDAEANELLSEQGVTVMSRPETGRPIRLRRAANLSSGGKTTGISEELHPDNIRLCERIAKILRLDIAGVDLLIPDHTKSVHEVGGGICEVNAQPQIGFTYPHIFGRIFDEFLTSGGRIPVVLVLTDAPERQSVVEQELGAGTGNVRIISDLTCGKSMFDAVRAALVDPETEKLVIVTSAEECVSKGLSIDAVDLVWVSDWGGSIDDMRRRLATIAPHVTGSVLVSAGAKIARVVEAMKVVGSGFVLTNEVDALEQLRQKVTQVDQSGAGKGTSGGVE